MAAHSCGCRRRLPMFKALPPEEGPGSMPEEGPVQKGLHKNATSQVQISMTKNSDSAWQKPADVNGILAAYHSNPTREQIMPALLGDSHVLLKRLALECPRSQLLQHAAQAQESLLSSRRHLQERSFLCCRPVHVPLANRNSLRA